MQSVLNKKTNLRSRPLETSKYGVLDVTEVGLTFGGIKQQIRSGAFWSESPEFSGYSHVKPVSVNQIPRPLFKILCGKYFTLMKKKINLQMGNLQCEQRPFKTNRRK